MTVNSEQPARVNVVGLGYVGVEVCMAAMAAGHRVAGIDTAPERLRELRAPSPEDLPDPLLDIREAVRRGDIDLYQSASDAPAADVWLVAVPTPLTTEGCIDTSAIDAAARAVATAAPQGALVILESTVTPGTTEEVFLPPFVDHGRTPGVDLFVGYSPERVNPGGTTWKMRTIPKVIAGSTSACLERAMAFYRSLVDSLHPVSDIRAAEMCKVYENSWRLINIAFANEMEELCEAQGLDPWEIAEACRTKPFGYMGFVPGPGAGGHCIPAAGSFAAQLARRWKQPSPVLDSAIGANHARPDVVVERISRATNSSSTQRVLVIGVSYKANVTDTRNSSALEVLNKLDATGVQVDFHDPLVPRVQLDSGIRESVPLTPKRLEDYGCLAVLTAHDAIDWQLVRLATMHVIDLSGVLQARAGNP